MDNRIEKYYDFISTDLLKHTYLNVADGVIGYPGSDGRGYMLLGDLDYEIDGVIPFMVTRYGTRDEDSAEVIKRYKKKIMEKLWGFKI